MIDFLVIGAQKCATSWIYYCLRDHPRVRLPAYKREVEYLGGDLHAENGDAWYLRLLGTRDAHTCVGDVSVEYLFDVRSPAHVARLAPSVKLIVSLRDPLERAVSAFYWYQRKGKLPEMHLVDALARMVDMADTWPVWPDVSELADPILDVVARGWYDVQLRRWLDAFSPDQFLVLDYAEVADTPQAALDRVFAFLGIDSVRPSHLGGRPKRNTYSPILVRLERLAPRFRPWIGMLERLNRIWPARSGALLAGADPDVLAGFRRAWAPSMEATVRVLEVVPRAQRPERPSFAGAR